MKKIFTTWERIGRARYVVSFHDGTKRHADGSPFFDIRIFSNRRKLQQFENELRRAGFRDA